MEVEQFIKEYSSKVRDNKAALFIGSGVSFDSGGVSWAELMQDIAAGLKLNIVEVIDYMELAQFHINKWKRNKINDIICEKFEKLKINQNHKLLATLPIDTYFTTNYDTLIEDALKEMKKNPVVIKNDKTISISKHNSKASVYKLHGDVNIPIECVLSTQEYEDCIETNKLMFSTLKANLATKSFLFLGYSFSDFDIKHTINRVVRHLDINGPQHYYITLKKTGENKEAILQELMKDDYEKNHNINTVFIDRYEELPDILKQINKKVNKDNIFLSGSYEFDDENREMYEKLIEKLVETLLATNKKIYSGFGKTIGSAVVSSVLNSVKERMFDDCLQLYPFPQVDKYKEKEQDMYEDYRNMILSNTQVCIVIAGKKKKDGQLIVGDGCIKEAHIALEKNQLVIPLAFTGGAAKDVFDEMMAENTLSYVSNINFTKLNEKPTNIKDVIDSIMAIIGQYTDKI